MANGPITLVPGVNSERTPMLLRAGFVSATLCRFKDSLIQKIGGWSRLFPFSVSGVPRDLHAWQDNNNVDHLAVGTTGTGTQLGVITGTSYKDITPQTLTSDFAPNVKIILQSGIHYLQITDPNINGITQFVTVFFNTPISVGGVVFSGLYSIPGPNQVLNPSQYAILPQTSFTDTTPTNPIATNGLTAAGNNILHFPTGGSFPSWLAVGMSIASLSAPSTIPANTVIVSFSSGTGQVVMSNNATGAGVANGASIIFCALPVFTTANGSSQVNVNFHNHGLSVGDTFIFPIATTFNNITIQGAYTVGSIPDADDFTITASTQANATTSISLGGGAVAMNNGKLEIVYYIAVGPPPIGTGFGIGSFGDGSFGLGAGSSIQLGTEVTATDWTTDNWGQILVACPTGGGIYYWDPTGGFANAQIVPGGPPFNTGIFVSSTQQILVAYGSSEAQAVGQEQQDLLVQWSDSGDFLNWVPSDTSQAGNRLIPNGSKLVAGLSVSNQNLLFTDLDLWAMNYIGPPDVFGFVKIGAGMGAVSSHAVQALRGGVYWMSRTNLCSFVGGSPSVIPCPVWDAVFQNINTSFLQNVRAMPNTPFNEVGWLYPSLSSTSGECDSYVKFNITEPGAPWDYGIATVLQRSAWIDQNVFGMPIAATSNGVIYQHETTNDAAGVPLTPSFTTGYFYLDEGEDFVFIDQLIPDFKWATFQGGTSAQVQISFSYLNYPGDTPTTIGPFTVTSTTEYIQVRLRARLMSVTVASADLGSFWRLGSIKYRYAKAGRR